MNKKWKIIVIGAVLLIGALILTFFGQGKVTVTTEPSAAEVTVNGRKYIAPVTIWLAAGSQELVVGKKGYLEQEQTVKVKPWQTQTVAFKLVSEDAVEPTNWTVPDAVGNLPFENDHFRLDWNYDTNSLEIAPDISINGDDNPSYAFQKYWEQYRQYGIEALAWLESHGLGEAIRQQNSVSLIWWGQEFWPAGARIP